MFEFTVILLAFLVYVVWIVGYAKKKSDISYWSILFFCWLLMFVVTNSYDLSNYRWAYENGIPHGKEKTYDILQEIALNMGCNFYLFKFFWQSLTIVFLYQGLKKYTEYKALLAATFLIVPFLTGFQTQMRSSLAGAIVIFAFPYLFEETKKGVLKYIIWVILAASIHIMASFYLIFLIIPLLKINERRLHIISIFLSVVATLTIHGVFEYSTEIIQLVANVSNENLKSILYRVTIYLDPKMRSNLTGFMFSFLHQAIVWFLTYRSCKVMTRCNSAFCREAIVICKMNDIMLLLIPFYVITLQVNRIFYYFLPVCYGAIIQYVIDRRKVIKKRFSEAWMLILLYGTTVFVYFVGIYSNPEEFVKIIKGIAAW